MPPILPALAQRSGDTNIGALHGWEYGDFLLRMHGPAVRIRDELAPEEARDDIDRYLQRTLGYHVRKPLAST
jgi:hypothetical protein